MKREPTVLHGEEARKAKESARRPLPIAAIVELQDHGIRPEDVRIADFYAGEVPEQDEKTEAWRRRWTAAYNAACWAREDQ